MLMAVTVATILIVLTIVITAIVLVIAEREPIEREYDREYSGLDRLDGLGKK